MNRFHSPLRRIVALTAFALVTLAMAGCSKKVTVDPGYTQPEGRVAADARLIVFPDLPVPVETWRDTIPEGPSDNDWLLSTTQIVVSPGALYGMIMDGTPASAYQILRQERNGGFAQLNDYLLNPTVRFLDSQWELYQFVDQHPSGRSPATYVGRGLVAGEVTPTSPLTNFGAQQDPPPSGAVQPLIYTADLTPPDSNFTMTWLPVDGAVGYWIQIYDFKGDANQRLYSARPAPFVSDAVRNMFIGYVAGGSSSSYTLGQQGGAQVLLRRPLLRGVGYYVRISAVNDEGRMIAFTFGPYARLQAQYPGITRFIYTDPATGAAQSRYDYYPVGAYVVTPGAGS